MESFCSAVCLVVVVEIACCPSTAFSQYPTNGFVLQPSCKSQIYCESVLLHDVQQSGIYRDSKTFVDKKLKYPESVILANYKTIKDNYGGKVPPHLELLNFIDEHLEDGDELDTWHPPDLRRIPSIVNRIADRNYKVWAYKLNLVWKTLARKVKDDVKTNPGNYSLIWVPNGFIIPGGRFRELYYWDTYWIVNGLLLCDMNTTAQGVIDNIISLVKRFGFMPNGARVYYLNRSQPPMLILMALSYYRATNDFEYVRNIISDLETEFGFWMDNRMVTFPKDGKLYTMARYYAPSRGPRPESYREDYETAERYDTDASKNDFFVRIKSATETGWDFSSRWFITASGTNRGELPDVQTPNIVPVDLNSILCLNALTLSKWFTQMGSHVKAENYHKIHIQFLNNIENVMLRRDKGVWFDWDLINHKHREYFYVSNIVPLWTGTFTLPPSEIATSVLRYLRDQRIIEADYSIRYNGTPTSLYLSSQQWDFPNAWSPLQAFLIQGLDYTNYGPAQRVAEKLAEVWLHSNYRGFVEKETIFEKYNVLAAGETGSNGEYAPQEGFGWSNGVIFELLNRWGHLTPDNSISKKPIEHQSNNAEMLPEILRTIRIPCINRLKKHAKRSRLRKFWMNE